MFEKFMFVMRKIYSWLLPYTCIMCDRLTHHQRDLCLACLKDLPIVAHSCLQCGAETYTEDICGPCATNPPPFQRCIALFHYQSPLTALLLDLKFHHQLQNAQVLGELLAEKIQMEKQYILPDWIVPVPLHPLRLKERGFNQALEIAKPVARQLKLPLKLDIVQRIKNTHAQMNLKEEFRKHNIQSAFWVNEDVTSKHIALVDDVMTTGATVRELATLLIEKGAARVDIWCVARAQKQR